MDNTSQNPYIPQESEKIRQQVYEHQSPLGNIVKISLIVTIVIAVLVGIGLFFVVPRTESVDQNAREQLANTLQPPSQTLKRLVVESEVGFKLMYDNTVYSGYAEVGDSTAGSEESTAIATGQRYESSELRVTRPYNYVRIRPIESVETARTLATLPPELEVFATVTNEDLEKAAKNEENKNLTKLNLFIKLDTDKRLEKKVADDNTIVDINVSNRVSVKVGDIDYQRVKFTTTNENHRVVNVKYDECYYTIQNDEPFSACITGVRPGNVSAASLVEKVLSTLTYHKVNETNAEQNGAEPDAAGKSTYALPTIKLAQAVKPDDTNSDLGDEDVVGEITETPDMSPLFTVTPDYYKDSASLKSIAKSQPSIVRIGTIYCADLTLKYQSGDVATTLTDACTGSVSTGAIISKDGYVATTGFAVRSSKKSAITGYINSGVDQDAMIERLQRVLDYLVKAGQLMDTDVEYILQGAKIGDQEALAKVENITSAIPDDFITAVKEEYTYAVQPSDKPIVVNRTDANKPSFAYSDSVLKAKHIASNYEAEKVVRLAFNDATPKNDIGLLKIESDREFQHIPIAKEGSVKANDVLSVLGYTAYTDSSLTIAKTRNIPVVVTNKVEQAYEKDGTKLIQTDAPVLPGSGGAPVLNAAGEIAGFASYGFAYCPGQQCFASGTVRSSNELVSLLNESNIKLNTNSKASEKWRLGVDEYFRANYASSTSAFASAGSMYAFNRWATPLNKLSSDNKGNASDTSLMNQLQVVMIVTMIVLGVATVVLAVAFVVHRKRLEQLQVGHYGVSSQQQSVYTPPQTPGVPPVQQQPPSQTNSVAAAAPVALPEVQQQSVPQQPYQQPQANQVPTVPPVQQPTQNVQQPQQPQLGEHKSEDPFYK